MLPTTLLLGLLGCASALKVDFWRGARCTNEPEGSFTRTQDDQCFGIPTDTEAATIEKQVPGDNGKYVAFYSSQDCSGDPVASTDGGCIDFTGTGKNAVSYNLMTNPIGKRFAESEAKKARRVETSSIGWKTKQDEARRGLHPSKWTGSLAHHWDPDANIEGGYGHGNVTHIWGKTWKWQQVALGVTIGIPIDDWDDNVHQKDDKFIAWTDDAENPEIGEQSHAVQQRANTGPGWNAGLCRALISCGRHYMGAITIGNGWAQTIHAAAKLKPYGTKFYNWAHSHPFSVSIAIGTGTTLSGYGLGYSHGGASAQDNDQLSQCASTDDEEDACIVAFTRNGAKGDNAAQVDMTLPNNHIRSFSAMVYEKGKTPAGGDECGVKGDLS